MGLILNQVLDQVSHQVLITQSMSSPAGVIKTWILSCMKTQRENKSFVPQLVKSDFIRPQETIYMVKRLLCRVVRINAMTAIWHNVGLRFRACCWIHWWNRRSSHFTIAAAKAEWIVMLAKDYIDWSSEFWCRCEDTAIGELDADCVWLFRS